MQSTVSEDLGKAALLLPFWLPDRTVVEFLLSDLISITQQPSEC